MFLSSRLARAPARTVTTRAAAPAVLRGEAPRAATPNSSSGSSSNSSGAPAGAAGLDGPRAAEPVSAARRVAEYFAVCASQGYEKPAKGALRWTLPLAVDPGAKFKRKKIAAAQSDVLQPQRPEDKAACVGIEGGRGLGTFFFFFFFFFFFLRIFAFSDFQFPPSPFFIYIYSPISCIAPRVSIFDC
jgi:hypothetical protein